MNYQKPNYAPNVVNQTVDFGGATWKGNPGQDWTLQTSPEQNQLNRASEAQSALLAKQKQENDARFASNKSDITDFQTRYKSAVPQAITDTENKYQIGTLLGQTNALNSRIKDLQGNVSGEGAGGYANSRQVDAAINSKYLPQYSTSVENLQRGSALAQNEESALLQPYQVEASMLNDRLSREATGYSQEQQNELSTLIGQMNAGVQLSAAQMQQASQLAQLEQSKYEFEKTLSANKQNQDASNRYIKMGDNLYDTQTGKIIQSPKSGGGAGETFS